MLNVFESVSANKRKSALVIFVFIIFTLVASVFISRGLAAYYGYQSSGLELTGIALVISGLVSLSSYYYSDRIILALSGARPADKKRDFQFFTVAENLSLAAGVPFPRLYVIDDSAMNAFATGRDPAHAVICATSGLLSRLDRTELEGVIGHEMSHVVNFDIRLMSIVTVLVGLITLLGDWLLRASWYGGRRSDREDRGSGVIFLALGIIFALLSPIIARLIQLAISRSREYLADASSVKLTRQPSGLISALKKLSTDREPLEAANKATAHLYIVNPLKNRHDAIGWFAGLFNTHPPLADRITQLEKMS
ncbi:zinc metalloprotease HtpX [Candidatus Amesbacteria bacterium RIFCSPLOWO2_02_FULL_48_11]|uniref:Protease HtpX homolog n=1 Tax=Candidatus Amesbacteria bacterium GW2011_GWA1_48_9 TaxID=1618355 RepID=A0A0G1UZU9_9BACT|nr:MAG: Protease HtpX-like protein [Candidatus Amesbacteria bacterium GW2011_GWA1_48_9]OGC89747.1 MAG: zinc metalloprotease HtpX [Candidatus Amesbacteria bacterium RBG_19FT_COMBO_48_16]OGC96710.1 MAG: zinc metalloprotease HtpX [Candidatus Amesbacteria bacterium RIFCSPHIGHO2_02_FULL_48_21]OGC99752.1 MAG: zinc metalloprotease HtpX [Candidatus Amesbacteria bacterium RIFCSPHIGHO2_01_FULL_48_75]OGD05900.1 MAG: zinc metalloprotease HtpX [Candidatus Amesbacteria bacterium RIFCSPLOWO2_02_FULL_48_11]OG